MGYKIINGVKYGGSGSLEPVNERIDEIDSKLFELKTIPYAVTTDSNGRYNIGRKGECVIGVIAKSGIDKFSLFSNPTYGWYVQVSNWNDQVTAFNIEFDLLVLQK